MLTTTKNPWFVDWCIQAHGPQQYGDEPYEVHLGEVAAAAIRFGFTSEWIQMLCWAHDTGEDCINPVTGVKYTRAEAHAAFIAAGFPLPVADAILAITDQPGIDRDEIKARTLPIIAAFIAEVSPTGFPVRRPVVLVKLFDRGCNLARGKKSKNAKYRRYQHEHPTFVSDLYDPSETELQPVWDWVNSLIVD